MAPSSLNDVVIDELFTNSIITDTIEEHGGALLAIETRYYGESQPTENLSLENLKYLSIENILLDFYQILNDDFKTQVDFDFNVIVVGEEIGATYGTFLRATYNETIRAGILFGATLDVRTNFEDYYLDIVENFKNIGDNGCLSIISDGLDELMVLLFNYKTDKIRDIFNLDESFDSRNKKDVAVLFDDFAGNYLSQIIADGSVVHLMKFCETIKSVTGSGDYTKNLEVLAQNFVPSQAFSYIDLVKKLQDEHIGLPHIRHKPLSSRQSLYQSCTELNWFRTTSALSHPFNVLIPVEFYFELCADVFGDTLTPEFIKSQHETVIRFYGANQPITVENIVFVYGALNPFRLLGVAPFDDYSARNFEYIHYGNTKGMDSLNVEKDSVEIQSLKWYFTAHSLQFYY